jgi:hypothetical protein
MSKSRISFFFIAYLGILVLLFFSSVSTISIASDQKEGMNVVFDWAFGSIRDTAGGLQFEQITADTKLNSRDRIKFFLKPVSGCFLYLIYQSSQGKLAVLFPYHFKDKYSEEQALKGHYIPEKNAWFQLDEHTGQERFHLLASDKRLTRLEDLINQYESGDNAKKPELSQQIVSEIDMLRRKNFKPKANAERPLSIVGNTRGTERPQAALPIDLAEHAVEISAIHFFIRTYTIDHR